MTPELPAPPTPAVLHTLIAGLSAYGRLYGLPNSPEQVQGILATLLRLHQPDRPAIAIDAVTQLVLDGLTSEVLKNVMVDRASSALAKAAHRWQQPVVEQATGVLATYLATYGDRYAPRLASDPLHCLAITLLPLLKEGLVTRSEALGLASYLAQQLTRPGAMAPVPKAPYLPLAEKLATALGQQPMAEAVADTVAAYVALHAPGLATIGADLIATALRAVVQNQVDFKIDTALTVLDEQLLIDQVSFQLNILQPSPASAQTMAAIADQLQAVFEKHLEAYRQIRPPGFDATVGVVRPRGISSSWTSTRPPDTVTAPEAEDFWTRHPAP